MASQDPPRRAPFIVIEGLDRSGKTTQVARLHAQLKAQGVEAALMKFPGTPPAARTRVFCSYLLM
jgi:dTMP kinase